MSDEIGTSIRMYLRVKDEAALDRLTDELADWLDERGFNADGDGVTAALAVFHDTPDVEAWALGPPERWLEQVKGAAQLTLPQPPDSEAGQ